MLPFFFLCDEFPFSGEVDEIPFFYGFANISDALLYSSTSIRRARLLSFRFSFFSILNGMDSCLIFFKRPKSNKGGNQEDS